MFAANITRDEAQQRSGQIDVDTYEVLLDLSGRDLIGEPLQRPEATFASASRIAFRSQAVDTTLNALADSITAIRLDGADVPLDAFDGERIALSLSEGEHIVEVEGLFRYSRTGEGMHRFVDPVDGRTYLYTQFETADARRAFATFEQPDLKASFQFSVIAPASWQVISNSPAVEPTPVDADRARWDFAPTPRISTYITAVCAGEFHTVYDTYHSDAGELPLSASVRQSLAEHLDAERIFTTTKLGFDVFEKHFGTPYPFADYAQVFVPEFNFGAMENAGCVTHRDEYIFRSRVTSAAYEGRDNTILHEQAHMWFGDLVTMTWWDDLWLNESFAEWASHFAQEEIRAMGHERPDPWATFCNSRKTWAYRQDQLPSTHPIAADMVDLEAVELNFDGITYAKGASALRQLVAFVGRDAFLAGVRHYFAAHAWGNTQLPDLLSALEESSGRDLSFFTSQWLQTSGVNTISAEWDLDGDTFTRFGLRQKALPLFPTLRRHRIAVGLYDLVDGRLTRTDRVELDIDGEYTEVPELVGRRRPALVLPNDGDLTYTKIRLDAESLATLVEHIDKLDSSLTRALAWGATWDLCRDGQMSSDDYVALVLRGIAVEDDLTAVSALLAQSRLAIDYYTPEANRHALGDRFTAGLVRLLKDAAPGSDHQLAFARALSTSIRDDDGAEVLKAWLAGEEVPEGLAVDTDLRWRLVTDLARIGAIGDDVIAAENERDNTAAGAEKAAGARAALKSPDAKAAAWQRALADDTPNETHFQVTALFWQVDQADELAPYVDAYLDAVEAISQGRDGWGDRSTQIRQHVLSNLFPRPLADQAFLDRLDAFMAERELVDSVRRLVIERRDDAARALGNRVR